MNYITLEAPATWHAVEAAAGQPKGRPKFSMVAYTGAPVRQEWSHSPVIVDLAGVQMPTQKMPIRRDHATPVGHTEMVAVQNGQIVCSGVLSFECDDAEEIAIAGKNGFPWQASIGGPVDSEEELAAGATATVNGRTITGPATIVRQMRLKEISFVDLGADSATSASIAAKAQKEKQDMDAPAPKPEAPKVEAKPAPDQSDLLNADAEVVKARREATIAASAAERAEHYKKQVMAMCPKGLEADAEALILAGKTVDDCRKELTLKFAERAKALPSAGEPAAPKAEVKATDAPPAVKKISEVPADKIVEMLI